MELVELRAVSNTRDRILTLLKETESEQQTGREFSHESHGTLQQYPDKNRDHVVATPFTFIKIIAKRGL